MSMQSTLGTGPTREDALAWCRENAEPIHVRYATSASAPLANSRSGWEYTVDNGHVHILVRDMLRDFNKISKLNHSLWLISRPTSNYPSVYMVAAVHPADGWVILVPWVVYSTMNVKPHKAYHLTVR